MANDVYECPICGFATSTNEVARYETDAIPEPNQVIFDPSEINTSYKEYILSSCPKCKSPFLAVEEYVNNFEIGTYLQHQEILYPTENAALLTLGVMPEQITKIYLQAKICFSKSLYEPSVIMSRKCLEAICKDLGATGKNLADKVENVKNTGKINDQLIRWATELRLIGNDAAHDLEIIISRQDAEDSLVFLNALLLYIYTLDKKFEDFLSRRSKAKNA